MNDPSEAEWIEKRIGELDHQLDAESAQVHHGKSAIHGSEPDPARAGRQHLYAEAYCLMTYECDHGHQALIWNSRDGVTPFIVRCFICGAESKHSYWWRDKYDPYHRPQPGEVVFAGMPDAPQLAVMQSDVVSTNSTSEAVEFNEGGYKLILQGNRAERRAQRFPGNRAIADRDWERPR